MSRTLTFDIETHSADYLYTMPPNEFVRLIGYAWDEEEVQITTDLDELIAAIHEARWIIGHNIHSYDLPAVFGVKSNIPMQLADEGRVYDTWTHAALVNPAPSEYIDRFGHKRVIKKPEDAMSWFGLDEQAHQLGVKGKTHDLKDLAAEWGGFGEIPIDLTDYRDYLIGDVKASRAVARKLLLKGSITDKYALREQRIESRKFAITSNGLRLDKEAAQARADALKKRRDEIMAGLVEKYDFPTEGKSPWSSNPGKYAILAAFADHGIVPNDDWPKTKSYANLHKVQEEAWEAASKAVELRAWLDNEIKENPKFRKVKGTETEIRKLEEKSVVPPWFGLSFSGDTLIALTKGTEIEELGKALAELSGQRTLSELALESCHPDGFVHPSITMLQKSGRWSTTKPGLTIWTSRGEGAVEKSYFLPDNDDHVLIEIDLSNADARAVAAMSGDKKYAERFEPGADGHLINAWAAWGKDVVGTDKSNPVTADYRQRAKVPGHGWGYRIGATTLSKQTGMPLSESKLFLKNMNKAFPGVVAWQERAFNDAVKRGYVTNPWGRKMPVDKGREFTQGPALKGQSVTREIMCDALLAFSHEAVRSVKAQIHDAMLFSIPRKNWEKYRDYLLSKIETFMDPKGGQRIEFPADCGPPARNWQEAGH